MAKATRTTRKHKRTPVKRSAGKQRGASHAPLRELARAAPKASSEAAVSGAPSTTGETVAASAPAMPVKVLLHDAKTLFETARRAGKKLVGAGLDERVLRELPTRIQLVADAQRAWERQQRHSTPAALRQAREDARELKTEMLAAGRYLLRRDAAAQREFDAIVEGDGIADLVADLRALADFYEKHADVLRGGDVPADAVTRARELATRLAVAIPAEAAEHVEAYHQRNRAVALLADAVSEVQAAGRYVFRDMPAKLALFRQELRHVRARHG